MEGVSLCVDLIAMMQPDALTHDLQGTCLYTQPSVIICLTDIQLQCCYWQLCTLQPVGTSQTFSRLTILCVLSKRCGSVGMIVRAPLPCHGLAGSLHRRQDWQPPEQLTLPCRS